MKKWQLSKKKMLGFLTAGAIVVTMAGSYAAWDQRYCIRYSNTKK